MASLVNVKLMFRISFGFCIFATIWCQLDEQDDKYKVPVLEGLAEHSHDHAALFDKNSLQGNQEHIMSHLEGVIDKPESEMNEDEIQFHYFKLHDYDGNHKLDGLEIINALTDYHQGKTQEKTERMSDEELMSVVDDIMVDEDSNKDGYIDYSEFAFAKQVHSMKDNNSKDEEVNKEPIV